MDRRYALEDRYTRDEGDVFLSGIQALARLPIEQLRVDRREGHRTAAFVSGYQGSPLAGYDQELRRALRIVPDLPIVHRPAVNEELAATAVMGSQLAATRPDARYEGVVGLWYGKAPGLDRASDALRHAVFAGTAPLGGAVAIVGDDPSAKSSTLPSSSDATFVDLHMPIIYPAGVQEALDLGRHAIALSRASGLWVGLKIEASVADGTRTIDLDLDRVRPVLPLVDGERYRCRPDAMLLSAHSLEVERELRGIRQQLAVRYAAENRLNRVTVDPPDPWIGIVASGYTYRETREALRRLGLATTAQIRDAGIRLLKMSMPIPFDPATVRRFARGLDELFVVEEMNPTLERWVREALYHESDRPRISGKHDPDGRPLLPQHGMLDADAMLPGLRARLATRLADRLAPIEPQDAGVGLLPIEVGRKPYFCSGCPHNRSTRVPDGSLVGAGIGCHTMALLVDDDRVGDIIGVTAMGNEGASWIGMADFVETDHLFQNLGDGTFFHSGQLAIQAAIAAGVNITFKLLYNGTVAMTGGQDAEGAVGVPEIVRILQAHGVAEVLVTTDDLERYRGVTLPNGAAVWDRQRLIEAQERLRAVPGVTVLVHDQACAAEARRKRKRGLLPTPQRRVAINPRLCEGCGDCGRKSSCLSVEPHATPFGRKTRINQHTCNLDYSCLDGDCPSFMTLVPAKPGAGSRLLERLRRAPRSAALPEPPSAGLPTPVCRDDIATWSIRMAGVGGTGVVTAAQIVGTAALLGGMKVSGLDQTGLSQKAGPVLSDLRLARNTEPPPSNQLGERQADALVVFDQLAAASAHALAAMAPGHTVVVGSTSRSPTGAMVTHPEIAALSADELAGRIEDVTAGPGLWLDASHLAAALTGSAVGANVFVIGAAVQSGAIPVAPEHVEQAIRLNGVAIDANLAAFRWGRCHAADPETVHAAIGAPLAAAAASLPVDLDALVAEIVQRVGDDALGAALRRYSAELVAYQSRRHAKAYLGDIRRVAEAEAAAVPGASALTTTAAAQLFKLLAYKDEYEVARLMLDAEGLAPAVDAIDGPARLHWRLHPPLLRGWGLERKLALPAWLAPGFRGLHRLKWLRGTRLDPFGRAEVRRVERALIVEYRAALEQITAGLTAANHAEAIRLASLADEVRGYEDLKLERAAKFRTELEAGLAGFCTPS